VRVVLVHGSVGNGPIAWAPVQRLVEHFELVVPNRGGYPPGPLLDRIDFAKQAAELAPLLADGAHLVGHSYGGVIALLMAARRPEAIYSLTVSEPPAFALARGNPEVARLVSRLAELFEGRAPDPAEFLRRFGEIVGSAPAVIDPLPADLEQGIRALMVERPPWEAEIPVDAIAGTPFRKLVISGGHSPAFDAVCDVLAERIGAERAVLPGAGHRVPRAPGYLELLQGFLSR